MKSPIPFLALLSVLLLAGSACNNYLKIDTDTPLRIETKIVGLSEEEFVRYQDELIRQDAFRDYFGNNRFRMLSFQIQEDPSEKRDQAEQAGSQQLLAEFYDYAKNQPVKVAGQITNNKIEKIGFEKLDYQPRPDLDEFNYAQNLLVQQLELGPLMEEGLIDLYFPMPPVTTDDEGNRILTIGIHSQTDRIKAGVYGVDMISEKMLGILSQKLYRLDEERACEIPGNTSCPSNGNTGQVNVTIFQGSTKVWTFQAVRPAASSGYPGKGSGVELRYVYFRGKKVLHRAHLPILNVRYDGNACGPYRDWQNQETCFDCTGTDVGNTGFRICNAAPQTIVDDLDDGGNFRGVAIYVKGQEVVLVSELTAGWYRYISEWTFHTNGTIKPRFKFAGVKNSCTCKLHFHHAYWRFDFDIHTIGDNIVQEYRKSGSNWQLLKTFKNEGKSFRNQQKKWRVKHAKGRCYDIIPGSNDSDGTGDSWAKGDVYTVRYRGNELEDGVACVYCSGTSATIQENVFLTNEDVYKKDVVVWYRASFDHNDPTPHPGPHPEIVGPDLVPIGKYWK